MAVVDFSGKQIRSRSRGACYGEPVLCRPLVTIESTASAMKHDVWSGVESIKCREVVDVGYEIAKPVNPSR